jgi:spermidine synthase
MMAHSTIERIFSFAQTVVFKHAGKKFSTHSLKSIMDVGFAVFEKVGCKFDVVSSLYLKFYQEIVAKELAMAHVHPSDHVLVIGSGSLPATPALLAMNTKAAVVSIDRDRTAVKQATRYVKSHRLRRNLSIDHADGLHYPVERFDVIFVLYGVKQPNLILEYLAEHCHDATRIILRAITDSRGVITDKRINLNHLFIIRDSIQTDTLGSMTSFLLQKKPTPPHHTLII